ncbi:protein-disulfide reductase DsbD family protein [Candidatus Marimicrobium litorale]|uniref:Protein-disulfide reductase DsbD n=1 Tax=Candidatus Marimicrobium litorale TaxID=2518991 RepID=A0ABT3TA70_9GAMM|nr:protein-disulfide reductase DsbD [Candidatus Marimicrobium litorale]MCX2979182.1 protein-disulfide reductase DsbD [Candidatus Marimicrobium litorale]
MRLILAGLLLASTVCFAQAVDSSSQDPFKGPATSEFLPVAEAYGLEVEVISERQLRLFWRIAPDYYLYQHRFDFTLQDEQGDIGVEAQLPAAITHTDDFFGEVQIYYHGVDMTLDLSRDAGRATLTATSQGCADAGLCYPPYTLHFDLNFETGAVTPVIPAPRPDAPQPRDTPNTSPASTGATLAYMLILAFVGGSILNLMPCVFPVLSLKVLSFARNTDHDRHLHSWVYTAGVISSFVAVAALLIVLQQAGQAIGWGFQLQSPGFVIALAYLFIAMGLSLTGMVELGSNLMNTGSGLADQSGLGGSFFTGVLAVVVASPCTAPFMGTALGFAVSQPPLIGLTVFAALGAGMAAPLLVFSYSGAARAIMPKPGPWMETLKQFLSFPLYATAIWLLWVAGRQTGVNTMAAALLGALLLALGLWLWRVNWWRRSLALACLAGAIALASMRGLDGADTGSTALSADYLPWSGSEVAALRQSGRPVFVDVTADWCITCKANETTVLFTDDITTAFAEHGVVYMIADWTNEDPKIAELLKKHQRNGIPLYLMYPADPTAAPLILPQLLTKRMVIDALEEVSVKSSPIVAIYD